MSASVRSLLVLAAFAALACARKETPASGSDLSNSAEPAPNAVFEPPTGTEREAKQPPGGPRRPDVEYVPTPQPIVDKMLELARLKKTDLLYDLGCGDGRIVVTAAKKYGVKAVGYDIDPKRVAEARDNAKKSGVEDLVTIELKDIFTLDLSRANVVTLYLLPELNVKLIPQLDKLAPGSRVISHDFDMEGVTPDKKLKLRPAGVPEDHAIYLFNVPLTKVGK